MLKLLVDFNGAGVGCLILKYKQQNHEDLSVMGEKSTGDSSVSSGSSAPRPPGWLGGGVALPLSVTQVPCAVDSKRSRWGEALRPFSLPPAEKKWGIRWFSLAPESLPT